MFKEAGLIPNNIYFSNAWIYNGLIKNSDYEPNYYVNHSGGAVGSDSYWGAIGENMAFYQNIITMVIKRQTVTIRSLKSSLKKVKSMS